MAEDCIRVLVVDDTVTYRNIVKFVLSGIPGIEVVGAAANGKIALDKIEQLKPDMMTLDLEMPVMDGLEVLRHLKQSDTVGHFPPGASKWNLIEHRMFSLISGNWAGEPLTSYEVVLKYIGATRSTTGFRCRAKLDKSHYPKKTTVTDEQKAAVLLQPNRVLPKWNYTIRPRKR
jgi:DNA-binding LytR/AlgR family response regulator